MANWEGYEVASARPNILACGERDQGFDEASSASSGANTQKYIDISRDPALVEYPSCAISPTLPIFSIPMTPGSPVGLTSSYSSSAVVDRPPPTWFQWYAMTLSADAAAAANLGRVTVQKITGEISRSVIQMSRWHRFVHQSSSSRWQLSLREYQVRFFSWRGGSQSSLDVSVPNGGSVGMSGSGARGMGCAMVCECGVVWTAY